MVNDTRVLAVKALEDHVKALEDQTEALEKQVQLIQGQANELEAALKGLETSTASAADPVDPLEEATRQAVRGIRLDGLPERKSPKHEPEPTPEPPSDRELRERFRDVTLQLLRES